MKYKETGVEWLGKVPEHWKVDRLKDNSTIVTGNTPSKKVSENYENGTIPWVKPENLRGKFIEDSTEKLTEKGLISARLIPENSILVGCIGDIGNYAVSKVPLTTNQQINSVIFDQKKVHFSYGRYIIESSRGEHWKNSTIVVVSILNKSRQGIIQIPVPPLNEQIAIANYLDKACERIDKIIKIKEKQIKDIKNYYFSELNSIMTCGYKKEGVFFDDFIKRKIPSDWKIDRLKDVVVINDKALSSNTSKGFEFEYIDISNVNSDGIVEIENIKQMSFEESPSRARRITKKFDTIISSVRTNLQAVAYLDLEYNKQLIASTGFFVVRPKFPEILLPKFLYYFLLTSYSKDYFFSRSVGVSYPAINDYKFGSIRIFIPSQNEQKKIVKKLDRLKEETKNLENNLNYQIKTLKNYRKSLIHEYVTGKKLVEKHTNKA